MRARARGGDIREGHVILYLVIQLRQHRHPALHPVRLGHIARHVDVQDKKTQSNSVIYKIFFLAGPSRHESRSGGYATPPPHPPRTPYHTSSVLYKIPLMAHLLNFSLLSRRAATASRHPFGPNVLGEGPKARRCRG